MEGIKSLDYYIADIKKRIADETIRKKINPVHEIVNAYYKVRGWDNLPKSEYKKREKSYGYLSAQANRLFLSCGGNLEDALWAIDAMNYKANKGHFEWTISTCNKHKLTY